MTVQGMVPFSYDPDPAKRVRLQDDLFGPDSQPLPCGPVASLVLADPFPPADCIAVRNDV